MPGRVQVGPGMCTDMSDLLSGPLVIRKDPFWQIEGFAPSPGAFCMTNVLNLRLNKRTLRIVNNCNAQVNNPCLHLSPPFVHGYHCVLLMLLRTQSLFL